MPATIAIPVDQTGIRWWGDYSGAGATLSRSALSAMVSVIFIGLFCPRVCLGQQGADANGYFKVVQTGAGLFRAEISSDVDQSWVKWSDRSYNFGFDPGKTPMPVTVNGILSTPYMIQVRGDSNEINKKRWGFHLFEGYARDNKSRLTMLLNKHVELDKPVAELYYYGTQYDHTDRSYNWIRIGSDVRKHSFLFSRDKAIFYGSVRFDNVLTLGNISRRELLEERPAGDPDKNADSNDKYVKYKELRSSGDGAMFYDSDNHIVVIKIDGKWMRLKVEPLPDSLKYDF